MLGAIEQKKINDFESDFLKSELAVYDLSSCLAGYLKGMLVNREIYFDTEVVQSRFIELLSIANEKNGRPQRLLKRKRQEIFFGLK